MNGTNNKSDGALRYRPDIDGLRTIAVVPVVMYHANQFLFSGGFVGVDVFFVISGYLITGILLASIRNNSFSIADFYKRRIKRIFPALLLVIAATTLAAWLLLPPDRLVEYGKSLGFVTIFSSNFYFWKSVNYFSSDAHIKPLLHSWSLSVEEQFYIFYPILLYLLSKTRLKLHLVLIAIGALSLALAVVLIRIAPGSAFYLLPPRAWELVIGGVLACGFPAQIRSGRIALMVAAVGLAMILLPVLFYTSATVFPGLAAVPPTLGAALLIWTGGGEHGPIHRLLSSRPFVLVGQSSYSFYLWHFPIFAFVAYLHGGKFSPQTGLLLSLAAFLASLATLKWLETPIRHSRSPLAVMLPLIGMVLAGLGAILLAQSDGFPQRLDAKAAHIAAVAGDKTRHHSECMSSAFTIVPVEQACHLGVKTAVAHVMLWGDSHAMVTATAMEAAAIKAGAAFEFVATADCPPGLGFSISPDTQADLTTAPAYRFCQEYNRAMLERVSADPQIHSVVLSARWTNWRIGEPANPVEQKVDIRLQEGAFVATSGADNAQIFERGFIRLIDALQRAGKTIYIVGPLAEPQFDVPQTLYVARFGFTASPRPIPLDAFYRRHQRILAMFDRLRQSHVHDSSLHFIWPHSLLCRQGFCPLIEGVEPVYLDHNHLSVHAGQETAPLYAEIFRNGG
jgi:peptidoglycan/LPS O-acetylase OafA/YrhL